MRVVGIDTSARTGSVALVEDGRLAVETTLEMERKHSERLTPALEQAMRLAGWNGNSVDLVCVSVGPGPFTGVRIGVTCAKSLAYAWGAPVVGVPTFDAIAHRHRYLSRDLRVLFDARKSQVFAARYAPNAQRIGEARCCAVADALEGVSTETLFVGNGSAVYRSEIVERLGGLASFGDEAAAVCRASDVVAVGSRSRDPVAAANVFNLAPLYIRRPEAEVSLMHLGLVHPTPEGVGFPKEVS